MTHLNFLEMFDDGISTHVQRNDPRDMPGYDAGYQAGLTACREEQKQFTTAFIDKLQEIRFSLAEAQHSTLASLDPFIHALCEQILPDIVDDVTRSKLIETLLIAAREDVSKPITVTVHPDKVVLIESVMSSEDLNVSIKQDSTLGSDEVLIGSANDETHFNAAAMIEDMRSALSAITHSKESARSYG